MNPHVTPRRRADLLAIAESLRHKVVALVALDDEDPNESYGCDYCDASGEVFDERDTEGAGMGDLFTETCTRSCAICRGPTRESGECPLGCGVTNQDMVGSAPPPETDLLERLLLAAAEHGLQSDDPDHEVGDLRDLMREIWEHVPLAARAKVAAERADYLEQWHQGSDD